MASFDVREHPRDRFGRFRDTVGDASIQILDAIARHDERAASDPELQKRIYENYRGLLKGNLVTEGKAVDDVNEAKSANEGNERFQAAQARFGADSVVIIKPDTEGFASGALAERRGRTSFVQDRSGDSLDWPPKARGDISPGEVNATDGLDGVLRHEYGHSVYDTLTPEEQQAFREALPGDHKDTKNHLSYYAGLSQRTGKMNEPFAELFSVLTHNDYDREKLDRSLHRAADVMQRILGG